MTDRTPGLAWISTACLVTCAAFVPPSAEGQQPRRLAPATPEARAADEAFRKQDWAAAAKAYEEITRSNPKDGVAWYRLGYALHADGKYEAAIKAHRKAGEFPDFKAVGHYNLACALALTDDKDGAFTALDEAIEAGFQDMKLFEADTDLTSLRKDPRFAAARRRLTPINELVREFDFWVGDWDAFDAKGNKIGSNRIEKVESGCLIVEHWTSARGHTGRSINFIDPVDRTWRQVWVDGSGNVVRYEGVVRDGAMHFTGTYSPQRGSFAIARATLTPMDDGRVKHVIQHSEDEGKTWKPYFDGVYARKNDATAKNDASEKGTDSESARKSAKRPSEE